MSSTEGSKQLSTSQVSDSEDEQDYAATSEDEQDYAATAEDEQDSAPTLKTVRFRGQPNRVHNLYTKMSKKQMRAIMKTEFRGTLNVGMEHTISGRLVLWLMRRVDPIAKTLTLENADKKKVVIDLKKATRKIFLVPNEGKTVPLDHFAGGRSSGKGQDIGSESPGNKKAVMRLEDYLDKMKTCRNLRKRTFRIYMYGIISTLLAPNSSTNVERRLKNMLKKVKEIESWNWTDFIVDCLVKSISKVLRGRATWLVGCPLLLVVIFLDMIDDKELDELGISEGFPRVKHLKDEHLDWLMKQKFDSLNIKDLSVSVNREDAPFIIEKETEGDGGEEEDVFDDDGDDEMDDGDTSDEDDKEALLSDQAAQASRLIIEQLKETLDSIPVKDTVVKDLKTTMTKLDVEFCAKLNNAPGMPSDSNEKDGIHKILQDWSSAHLEAVTPYVQSHNDNLLAVVNHWMQYAEHVTALNKATRAYIEQAEVQGLSKRGRKRRRSKIVNLVNTPKGTEKESMAQSKRGRKRRSSKIVNLVDTPKGTEKESMEQSKHGHKRRSSKGQDTNLPARCERSKCLREAGFEYPASDLYVSRSLILQYKDLECLYTREYASDRIMDFYICHLHGKFPFFVGNYSNIKGQFHISSPHFWDQILRKQFKRLVTFLIFPALLPSLTTVSCLIYLGLFLESIKYYFIPVIERSHWTLSTIYMPKGKSKMTTIYMMDSLRTYHNADHVLKQTKSFAINVLGIKAENIVTKNIMVPQQKEADCAFFTLYNIQRIIEDVSSGIPLETIVEHGESWYAPADAVAMREKFAGLIQQHHVKLSHDPEQMCHACKTEYDSVVEKYGHEYFIAKV